MNQYPNDPTTGPQPPYPGQVPPYQQQPGYQTPPQGISPYPPGYPLVQPPKPPLFDIKARREYFRQYPPSKKQQLIIGVGMLIGVLALCGICGAITNAGSSSQQIDRQSTSQSVPSTPTPTPKPMTTQERVMAIIKGNDGDTSQSVYDGSTKSVNTTVVLGDQWSNSTMRDSVKSDCFNIQKALWTAFGLEDVTVFVKGDVVDAYGHTSIAQVGFCSLKSATAVKFNWDNLSFEDAWNVYDNTGLAPVLQSA